MDIVRDTINENFTKPEMKQEEGRLELSWDFFFFPLISSTNEKYSM